MTEAYFLSINGGLYDDFSYLVRITATDALSISTEASISDTFQLTFSYPCAFDTVSQSNSQDQEHVQVLIDESTSTDLTIEFTESITGCSAYLVYGLWFFDED